MNRAATTLAAAAGWALAACSAAGDPLVCDLRQYQEQPGLRAAVREDQLQVQWQGKDGVELRLVLAVNAGRPLVRELAAKAGDGGWRTLGQELQPEFMVTSGLRRISQQQLSPLRRLGREVTPEIIEREKWNVFWDAPLTVPGVDGINLDMPRKADEIRRSEAQYSASGCEVTTNGARLEVSFDGLSMGIFSGRLGFTVYRGTNLVRMEAIARTDEPSVAYKYRGGLAGFQSDSARRVLWRDTGGNWQKYEFGGDVNGQPVALRARNRLAIVESSSGSVVVFPPPHKFFWAREIELNLGYVWYRKDDEQSFAVGVRHGDREEMFRPYGVSAELWEKRVRQSRRFAEGNFALYNAAPGTRQHMPVYFYLSTQDARSAQGEVLAFTHDDRYKPLPGYKVAVSHFHTHFAEQIMDDGSFDSRPPWISAFCALGVNIAMMSDFHGDGHPNDPGELRLREQQTYFDASHRHSDREFLIVPSEEPNMHLGGHYTMVLPRPVYYTKVRRPGQPLVEKHPEFGTVYHLGSAKEELEMLRREEGLVWQAHPRTKGSTGYPDVIRDTEAFRSDRYLGAAFQSMPVDLSEKRLGEIRCFGLLDDMNNWAGPKFLVAEGDTYTKYPHDEIYGELAVNYIKVDPLPRFQDGWGPVTRPLRQGDFFVTTGEVLLHSFQWTDSGGRGRVVADVEWTFPLEFVEVVWGDGQSVERKLIRATDKEPFSRHKFSIPFDPAGKKWVRLAVWDSAGNGAFTQPVHF